MTFDQVREATRKATSFVGLFIMCALAALIIVGAFENTAEYIAVQTEADPQSVVEAWYWLFAWIVVTKWLIQANLKERKKKSNGS